MPAPQTRLGRYIVTNYGSESVRAYLPPPLPPDPPVDLTRLQTLLEQANRALGRMDGISFILPDPVLFLYGYIRKEAVMSSQIEGNPSSLSDLLIFETADVPGVRDADVIEVSNYVAAMNHGLRRVRSGFPISSRLICEVHEVLLARGRGSDKLPGEFRRSQNRIGGTRPGNAFYVPPPPDQVPDCMHALGQFIHDVRPDLPPLVKVALAHVQFESIHPFLNGNGRLGRLLMTLMLAAENVLRDPLLYLSLYLKRHRRTYYELLNRVREIGEWEAWLEFFLTGVRESADEAAITARRIWTLHAHDQQKIAQLGRPGRSAQLVYAQLQRQPMLAIPNTAKALGISAPTVTKSLEHLRQLGIVREVTGRQRDRIFMYDAYVSILNEGTEIEKTTYG
jgi:Fic family protein